MSYKFTFQLTLSLKEGDYTVVKEHDEDCAICLEREGREWAKLDCGHYFHKKCLVDYLRMADYKKCPLCRSPIEKEDSCVVT